MANILDIRRRIRSVVNTRQITKAMKTVSAAKLRRAQEAALASRPYSQMLTNILKSLVSRVDIYDPQTGEPRHPLLADRPEKSSIWTIFVSSENEDQPVAVVAYFWTLANEEVCPQCERSRCRRRCPSIFYECSACAYRRSWRCSECEVWFGCTVCTPLDSRYGRCQVSRGWRSL